MNIFQDYADVPAHLRGGVVALGNFDGFHRGHQAVIGAAASEARLLGAPLWVFTTEPHPQAFFRPDAPSIRLTPLEAKIRCLETFGVENMLVLPFDPALCGMLAQDFVMKVLVQGLGIKHAVSGYDYRFGKGRAGGVDVLKQMGEVEQFGVTVVAPITEDNSRSSTAIVYSSTLIRKALQEGQVREATEALGHWWFIDGRVVKGDQRGRTIGFPTANISMDGYMLPVFGVYAVRMVFASGQVVDGVANIGKRPTFDKSDVTLEVHLFDFSEEIYDQTVRVEIVDFIRAEQRFSGLDELKAQIAKDSAKVRELLAAPELARELYRLPRFKERYLRDTA